MDIGARAEGMTGPSVTPAELLLSLETLKPKYKQNNPHRENRVSRREGLKVLVAFLEFGSWGGLRGCGRPFPTKTVPNTMWTKEGLLFPINKVAGGKREPRVMTLGAHNGPRVHEQKASFAPSAGKLCGSI